MQNQNSKAVTISEKAKLLTNFSASRYERSHSLLTLDEESMHDLSENKRKKQLDYCLRFVAQR